MDLGPHYLGICWLDIVLYYESARFISLLSMLLLLGIALFTGKFATAVKRHFRETASEAKFNVAIKMASMTRGLILLAHIMSSAMRLGTAFV